jgi:hypothetical protein
MLQPICLELTNDKIEDGIKRRLRPAAYEAGRVLSDWSL